MKENGRDAVERIHREEVDRLGQELFHPFERPTLHHTELPLASLDSPLCQEWNTYRREVARLLAEGNEGRWVLIVDQEIVGLWDTEEEANRARLERFSTRPVLVKQILTREPIVRCTRLYHPGFLDPCRS
jgi:hypothetical protein